MYELCEKKQLKELMDQKRKDLLLSSMFFFFLIKFGYKKFDNLIKCIKKYFILHVL